MRIFWIKLKSLISPALCGYLSFPQIICSGFWSQKGFPDIRISFLCKNSIHSQIDLTHAQSNLNPFWPDAYVLDLDNQKVRYPMWLQFQVHWASSVRLNTWSSSFTPRWDFMDTWSSAKIVVVVSPWICPNKRFINCVNWFLPPRSFSPTHFNSTFHYK